MYTFIKHLLRIYLPLFFKRIITEGRENIPQNEAVIFAVNHQNTFLDAVIPVFQLKKSSYFLVRSDLFKGRALNTLFGWLHLLPIYRKQDGDRNFREKNLNSFRLYGKKLSKGHSILIFPEGTSQPSYKLIPLKKGIARMSIDILQSELRHKKLFIVPVCIQYKNLKEPRNQLWIKYLKAIPVHEMISQSSHDSAKSIAAIMAQIDLGLRSNLLLDTDQKKVSEFFNHLPELTADNLEKVKSHYDAFIAPEIEVKKKKNFKFKYLLFIIVFLPTYLVTELILKIVKDKTYHLSILCFSYLMFGMLQLIAYVILLGFLIWN